MLKCMDHLNGVYRKQLKFWGWEDRLEQCLVPERFSLVKRDKIVTSEFNYTQLKSERSIISTAPAKILKFRYLHENGSGLLSC